MAKKKKERNHWISPGISFAEKSILFKYFKKWIAYILGRRAGGTVQYVEDSLKKQVIVWTYSFESYSESILIHF